MQENQKKIPPGGSLVLLALILNAVVMEQGFVVHRGWYALALVTFPLLIISIINRKRGQP